MRIAVTYDHGEIFQHFGHTETFKIYEVEDGKVLSSQVIAADGEGHVAQAGLLGANGVNVLICGGIGDGAVAALGQYGIELCTGVSGDADEAVEAYLRGELENTGVNCGHRHGDGSACGDPDGGSHCGGEPTGCSGCSGCGSAPAFTGPNVGKTCRTHYRGTFNDGTVFDTSYDRGEPLEFVCGAGMMIPGYDKAVANMKVGETVEIHLMPEEAYGERDPLAVLTVRYEQMPGSEQLSVGQRLQLQGPMGQLVPVTVTEMAEETITFDANHEMAGKELNFLIELVEVL